MGHEAEIEWKRTPQEIFLDRKYSRAHVWRFDGGAEVQASSSPHNVPLPFSKAENVDPEEAFVAAIASCHMLWFLAVAGKRGFVVDSYRDAAVGHMGVNEAGRPAITVVKLNPHVAFSGNLQPTDADLEALHHAAHEECFLANSVTSRILTNGTWEFAK